MLSLLAVSVLEADIPHFGKHALREEVQGELPRDAEVGPLSVLSVPGMEPLTRPEQYDGSSCQPGTLPTGRSPGEVAEDPRFDLRQVTLAHQAFLDAKVLLVRPVSRKTVKNASFPPCEALRGN